MTHDEARKMLQHSPAQPSGLRQCDGEALQVILSASLIHWNRVEDGLPMAGKQVLICDGEVSIGYVNTNDEWMENGCGLLFRPTHWAELPTPPTG